MLNFLWGGWFAVGAVKLGGDDDASKLGVHVGDGGLGLGAVPGGVGAGVIQVMGLVAGGGVPADGHGFHDQPERDGALHGCGKPVAAWPTPVICLASWIATSMDQRAAYRSMIWPAAAVRSVLTNATS